MALKKVTLPAVDIVYSTSQRMVGIELSEGTDGGKLVRMMTEKEAKLVLYTFSKKCEEVFGVNWNL